MAERQFGPYRLVRQIAVGGMAEIHLAKTKGIAGFEKYVALKMIHPNFAEDEQFIQMLVDEAKIAVQLNHGNIAQTFDLGRVGETYYITMEYVDGADLYKILRRASEVDIEMPLDVCAFVGKEIASALDHAHRKRDNFGKNLGIVHRDVSPQNVLVSYAGEVKLVDFGIAKATMKARQTAVGVIKGKYYYMSPEQAWGDPIDYRSDIFSAGIVIYEMITGQMLYLEEDLHKLLDMARKADIAPPSKLRRGVPPQLERIVMHALAKVPGERYQSAGDLASDLERFLHTYSPVFTAGKIAALLKQVVGDPMQVPNDPGVPSIEIRDGVLSTHEITSEELAGREEIRDENSVIFRVEELKPKGTKPIIMPEQLSEPLSAPPTPPIRVSDQTAKIGKIPSIAPQRAPAQQVHAPPKKPPVRPSRPRQLHEETRQLGSAPPDPERTDDSGLLDLPQAPGSGRTSWDATSTFPGDDDLENIGERTIVTAPGGGGYMMDVAGGDDGNIEATLITGAPQPSDTDVGLDAVSPFESDQTAENDRTQDEAADDDDGPTLSRDVVPKRVAMRGNKAPAPPALAAKIHAPAVSELRKPKPSRRTPPGGVPVQGASVLQAIVGSQASEPMPVPVPRHEPPPVPQPPPMSPYGSQQQPPLSPQPPQFPSATPGAQPSYMNDASGLPMGVPTPPSGLPVAPPSMQPGVPPHMQPYMQMQGMPPGYPQGYPQAAYPVAPGYPMLPPQQQPQHVTPGALYQFSPYGPQPHPMSLTGQMRLFEADELPSIYNLGAARRRWFGYVFAGILAVSVAAAATFFIIRSTRDNEIATCSVRIVTVPESAEVVFDGTRLSKQTPFTVDNVPCGSRHDLKIELALHKPKALTLDVPSQAGETTVTQTLEPVTGTIRVVTRPDGAEIRINDQIRGRSSTTVRDVDVNTAKKIELRLKDYQPVIQDLKFNAEGVADVDVTFKK